MRRGERVAPPAAGLVVACEVQDRDLSGWRWEGAGEGEGVGVVDCDGREGEVRILGM